MLSPIMLSVVLLHTVMLSVLAPYMKHMVKCVSCIVVVLSVIWMSAILLNVTLL